MTTALPGSLKHDFQVRNSGLDTQRASEVTMSVSSDCAALNLTQQQILASDEVVVFEMPLGDVSELRCELAILVSAHNGHSRYSKHVRAFVVFRDSAWSLLSSDEFVGTAETEVSRCLKRDLKTGKCNVVHGEVGPCEGSDCIAPWIDRSRYIQAVPVANLSS